MARNQRRPEAASELRLEPLHDLCGACGERSWVAYHGTRTVTTLEGSVRLRLVVRRCVNRECELYQESRRLEQEGAFALPQGEFGLDVIALVGALRHAEHRSVPEIHRELLGRGVGVSERTVTNLLDRYEELMALRLSDRNRLREALERQGRAILALDGLQPDVGHEVLWVVRECLSGEVLLARSLLSGTEESLTGAGLGAPARRLSHAPEGFDAASIRPIDIEGWRALRSSLEKRRETRRAQLRFRRDPGAYLGRLEEQLLKQALPS
jgi:hypothetical protein